ncbi:RNA methyltransferase [Entomospira culicis]|uniref:tRNA (cytidine/uridine-2'-O-)-methyltransferase TrmJ n=1 Tax=Entomospira culicis TaxID=2719989 RepID=A0A968KVF0_9SPIO|nr:RNA methyltransferase [Entomospira culicis]NIZ18823.1 RNA methyltransferase [Entomospira culicis]NIZ69038.1 RNA methyltransferase [Entomospira culicis]WDI37626.1 RNA methyltransferase [Entomospira culicis]WDI39254.1 RNA methyltransferase [Entomospira culicis]
MSCAKYVTVLENITIVLVRPEGQANIGAICRAMKAMGVHRLRIVDMQSPEDLTAIRTWSLSAFDIYENAQHFATLPQALADMTLVVATSRRLGKNRKFFSLTAKEFAQNLPQYANSHVAILFGNEKNGLNEEEVDLAHQLLYIPTSDQYPSLNLAQAVQLVCYELYQHNCATHIHFHPISAPETQQLAQTITNQLDSIGFFAISRENGERHLFNFWHAIIARAQLSQKEAIFLEKMMRQLTHMKPKESLKSSPNKEDKQSPDGLN